MYYCIWIDWIKENLLNNFWLFIAFIKMIKLSYNKTCSSTPGLGGERVYNGLIKLLWHI